MRHARPVPGDYVAGRYLIREQVTASPTQFVYRATDSNGIEVTLRLLYSGPPAPAALETAAGDARALRELAHPAAAGVIEAGAWDDDHLYVACAYVHGRTLRQILQAGPAEPRLAETVIRQTAEALDAAHRAGVPHLALSPETIVVGDGSPPRATVVDFGLARLVAAVLPPPVAHGRSYTAPEDDPGPPADVYSLARVIEEMMPSASGGVRRVLDEALSPDPARRPRTAGELSRRVLSTSRRAKVIGAAAAAVAVGGLLLADWMASQSRPAPVPLTEARPWAALKGTEYDPTFSPDGDRLYFGHAPSSVGTRSLYYATAAGSAPVRVTYSEGVDFDPAVSPDGKTLAFLRQVGAASPQICLTGPDGGTVRAVYQGEVQSLCFGGDSSRLYFTQWDPGARVWVVRRLDLRDGSVTAFPPAPGGYRGDLDVSVSPDGRRMALSRWRFENNADLFVWNLDGAGMAQGSPRRVTSLGRRVRSPRWSADGQAVVFAAGTLTRQTLWRARVPSFGTPEVGELAGSGAGTHHPAVARRGGRIAFVKEREDSDIWRFPLAPDERPRAWAASTALDEEARYSPDGGQVAFVSERSGSLQLWTAAADGSGERQITRFHLAERISPAWTRPDRLLFSADLIGQDPAVFASDGAGGEPRKLLSLPLSRRVVGFANDGEAVYVANRDNPAAPLERWPLNGGAPQSLAVPNVGMVRESPGGKELFFTRRRAAEGLFVMPRDGGSPVRLVESLARRTAYAVGDGAVYYAAAGPRPGLYAFDTRSRQTRLLWSVDQAPGWGVDLDPKGQSLLMAVVGNEDSDILVAEGFAP